MCLISVKIDIVAHTRYPDKILIQYIIYSGSGEKKHYDYRTINVYKYYPSI